MRLLGFDAESTGLDTTKDRVTEIGLCLWDSDTRRPLTTHGIFLYDSAMEELFTEETKAMMLRVSGITSDVLHEFGQDPQASFLWMDEYCTKHRVEYLVGHGSENYDRPLLLAELDRHGLSAPTLRNLPWLDTRNDLPFAAEPDSRKLKHLALDCGFINTFAHRAVFDVLTMLRVLSSYPLEDVISYSKIPFIMVRAHVSYDDRQLAKDARFMWEKCGTKTFPKAWVKAIKADQLEKERAKYSFHIEEIK